MCSRTGVQAPSTETAALHCHSEDRENGSLAGVRLQGNGRAALHLKFASELTGWEAFPQVPGERFPGMR